MLWFHLRSHSCGIFLFFFFFVFVFFFFFFFFFNDTATTEIYTLSLHDALPIWCTLPMTSDFFRFSSARGVGAKCSWAIWEISRRFASSGKGLYKLSVRRSEEHTSELQSLTNLVCRLLLEKKKIKNKKKNKKQPILSLTLPYTQAHTHTTFCSL